jgi:SAM-dependent methyltransferase
MTFTHEGLCPICGRTSEFVAEGEWLRDQYVCVRCRTIPRNRALVSVLDLVRPTWRSDVVHESSPVFGYFNQLCPRYTYSHYLPGVALGTVHEGVRCEDLENLTFGDGTFDVFITQDVLEHVFRPERALAEVMRCLRPGGLHVFTTPKHKGLAKSVQRAEQQEGLVVHLLEPVYHGNPIADHRSLVTWDYGADFEELAGAWGGYLVSTYAIRDRRRGIDGEYLEVFVQVRDELNRVPSAAR